MSMPEITKMLTISTGHVRQSTMDMLDREARENNYGLAVYPKDGFGYLIYLTDPMASFPEESLPYEEHGDHYPLFGFPAFVPKDLQDCMRYCKDMGCELLCLDSDGPEIPYLGWYHGDDAIDPNAPDAPLESSAVPAKIAVKLAQAFGWRAPIKRLCAYQDAVLIAAGLEGHKIALLRRIAMSHETRPGELAPWLPPEDAGNED